VRKDAIGLSNSEMAEWRRCRRKWYLSHYRRLRKKTDDEPGSATWIGNLVHDALAAYYDPVEPVDPVGYAEAALEVAIAEHPSIEDAARKEFEMVRIMLEGYIEWLAESGADAGLRVLGSEQTVRVEMKLAGEPVGVTLLAKLDAPIERESDGFRSALEHKTTDSLTAPIEGYRINTQFLTEHLARFLHAMEQGMSPEEAYNDCPGITVNLIRKSKRTARAKPPFYAREEVTHNIHELRNHWHHVVTIAREIASAEARLDAGEDHRTVVPSNPIPRDCSWSCPFFRLCPMMNDGSDYEGYIEAAFEEHDPLERYADMEEM
jgi:hypothetical protein